MHCYELREIVSEKLRGFLQTRLRFEERDAGKRSYAKSRPRELFDLVHLYRQTHLLDRLAKRSTIPDPEGQATRRLLRRTRCLPRPPVLDDMSATWNAQLGFFIRPLATFDESIASFKELLGKNFA